MLLTEEITGPIGILRRRRYIEGTERGGEIMTFTEERASDPYMQLANAVVIQAAKDYRDACRTLERGRRHYITESKRLASEKHRNDCLRFFRSAWFATLSDLDGEMLIRKLDEEINANRGKLVKTGHMQQGHTRGKMR